MMKDEYDINVLFPSNYVSSTDLQEPVNIRITRICKEKVPTVTKTGKNLPPEEKTVAEIRGTSKKWIINKTNGTALAAMFGDSLRNAQGKSITLVADNDYFGRDPVLAIRVRGSVDADPEVQREIDWAWDGDRTRGKYLAKLKVIVEKHRQRARREKSAQVSSKAQQDTPEEPIVILDITTDPNEEHL